MDVVALIKFIWTPDNLKNSISKPLHFNETAMDDSLDLVSISSVLSERWVWAFSRRHVGLCFRMRLLKYFISYADFFCIFFFINLNERWFITLYSSFNLLYMTLSKNFPGESRRQICCSFPFSGRPFSKISNLSSPARSLSLFKKVFGLVMMGNKVLDLAVSLLRFSQNVRAPITLLEFFSPWSDRWTIRA